MTPIPFGAQPKCHRCDKVVYFAEKVFAANKEWHKACFRCSNEECRATLTPGKETVHESEPYCARCYGIFFGPKGCGRGAVNMFLA